tara:strand:+ start:1191 stop:1586 length:396 start_codon:yes stop_codon:yes gene_type:complete
MIEKIKARGEELKTLEGHHRLMYLVDIAREVEPLTNEEKIDDNKIRGCASNLWVVGNKNEDGTMTYKHDGDAFITKGTAKIIIDIVNGEKAEDIAQLTLDDFKHLGIRELLTMQRQIGFAGLVEKIIRLSK